MHVLVTGGAGFIGANLCRHLVGDESVDEVIVLDDLSTGDVTNLDGLELRFVEGSFLDREVLDAACRGVDAIVHLGARPSVPRSLQDPFATHRANADGTVEVLEAARRHGSPHIVVASSSSVYGANPVLPKHEDLAPMPVSPYAASKLSAEVYALAYQASFGLPAMVFRFFNVYGPLQPAGHAYAAVVPTFIEAALTGRPLPLHGDGLQSRDFTYVDTVVEVLATAVRRAVTSTRPVNLAFGTRMDLKGLIALLERELGHSLEIESHEMRPSDVRHSQADTTALRALFPEVVPVELGDGLRATIRWFEEKR